MVGVCSAIVNAVTGFALGPGLTLGVANLSISLFTVLLYRARPGGDDQRRAPRYLTQLYRLICAASAATAVSSAFGMLAVALQYGAVSWSVAAAWFVRNLASVVVVVGATMGATPRRSRPTRRQAF